MKKALKILSLVLVFALVLIPTMSLADEIPFEVNPQTDELGAVQTVTGILVGILQWVGYGVAIVMVLWLGIQWMIAQPSKKAELKQKMWGMAIGIFLLVGGATIIGIVWNFANKAGSTL